MLAALDMTLVAIADALSDALQNFAFAPPITHVYRPLVYARQPAAQYMTRWGAPGKKALLVGMNPGPFGMAQTGVPFGDVGMVRDWLGIEAAVGQPEVVHPKRPVDGFACSRSEVSGTRLWGWAAAQFGRPEAFFKQFFVYNYCPLVFMEESGKNFTPDKLPAAMRARLFAACDAALVATAAALGCDTIIGIGGFAAQRCQAAFAGTDKHIGQVLHPSPASPMANRGWAAQATRALEAMHLLPERCVSPVAQAAAKAASRRR